MNITIKKEFQNLIFPLSSEEFTLLEQSILNYGIKDPLIIWRNGNGKDYLLDGHHRLKIARIQKIKKFPTKILKFSSKHEAINFIIENQLGRRNCSQEAISYLRGLRYRNEKLSPHRPKKGEKISPLKTSERLAQQYKITSRTIYNDEKFTTSVDLIIDIFPTPKKKKQVKNDLLTKHYKLSRKDIIELSTLSPKYIREVINNKRELWQARSDYNKEQKRKDLRKASKKSIPDNVKLYTGDCLKLSKKHLKQKSIDCIITDPAYADMECYNKLGDIANQFLKPSGFCCCYTGTMYLPQVIDILSKHLEYYWQIILLHTGSEGTKFKSQTLHGRKVDTAYKSILVFQKPPFKKVKSYFLDVVQGGGMEKEYHPWQQGEKELNSLVDTFSTVNSTILDPFQGSGTTAISCLNNHRKFIGFDIDRQCVEQTKARIRSIRPIP